MSEPSAPADSLAAQVELATVGATSTTLSRNRDEVVGFDLEGRAVHWFVAGETFKRSLASEVVGRRRGAGGRERFVVPKAEAERLFALAHEVAASAAANQEDWRVRGSAQLFDRRLADMTAWTPERLLAERSRFAAAYRPVAILPPDQYQSVVLQASFGCSWNRCTFCTFYQDRPFSLRQLPEFASHAQAVKDLLGRAAAARRAVFLADGNALALANNKLVPIFEVAKAAFPGRSINAFVDVFSGEKKSLAAWRQLRELGLERVAVGVETGNDELLAWLNKPGSAAEAAEFVTTLKAAGLAVSVIFMVGVGGRRFAAAHEADSLRLLAALPLDQHDIVYLSPFVVQHGSSYEGGMAADGVLPLSSAEANSQYEVLATGAKVAAPRAKVALYHLDEFVY